MPCLFTDQDVKICVDGRKLLLLRRRPRKSVEKSRKQQYAADTSLENTEKVSRTFYLPLRQNEIQFLGLSEDSYVKAEIARIEKKDSLARPSYEIQAELDRIKAGLKKILAEYDPDTSIRKSSLLPKIQKIMGDDFASENISMTDAQ